MLITAFCPHHHLEGRRRGAPRGEVEFSGCSRGMTPSSAVPPELVTDKNKRIQLPLSKSFSDFKHIQNKTEVTFFCAA